MAASRSDRAIVAIEDMAGLIAAPRGELNSTSLPHCRS
jgi:hypothetical protein